MAIDKFRPVHNRFLFVIGNLKTRVEPTPPLLLKAHILTPKGSINF